MHFNAAQIALLVNGTIEGDPDATSSSFGKIEEAQNGQLTFLANPKYEEYLYTTKASILIVNDTQEIKQAVIPTLIRVKDAYSAFASLLSAYQQMVSEQMNGIEEPSFISPSAKLGENIFVGAFTYIGVNANVGNDVKIFPQVYLGDNVTIGANTVLFPGVKIYHDCMVGKNVTIHAGTVIGSDGFGFAPQESGDFKKVPQIGNVIIEDNVEIGANTTIDRATIGSTIIRAGAKLDNLIQIAHNVEVGTDTVIAAQVGVSGSTKIGKKVMIGGQAGFAGHLQISDGSKIGAQSGVGKSLKKPNTAVNGSPAFDYATSMRSIAISRNLPDLEKRIIELEQLIQQLLTEKVNT